MAIQKKRGKLMKKDFLKKIITKLILTTTITMLLPLGVSAQWKQNLDRTWSYVDGDSLVNGWKNISEQWYYFNSNGKMEKIGFVIRGIGIT